MQFKIGIYQVRQITRIERGGIVISCADSRYQPDGGIRYELSPDEWLLYSYRFFPRDHRREDFDEEFLVRERYYDYFAERGSSKRTKKYIYSIFKNKHNTGYIIVATLFSEQNPNLVGESRTKFYSAIHINEWGASDYKDVFESRMVKPIYYATSEIEAAICLLTDRGDFSKVKIDIASLHKDCDESPGSCVLYSKLTKLLQDCNYTDLYIEK